MSNQSKFNELDSTTIDAFIAWTVDAINYVQMEKKAKQTLDALIDHRQRLLADEIQLRETIKEYWMIGKHREGDSK